MQCYCLLHVVALTMINHPSTFRRRWSAVPFWISKSASEQSEHYSATPSARSRGGKGVGSDEGAHTGQDTVLTRHPTTKRAGEGPSWCASR